MQKHAIRLASVSFILAVTGLGTASAVAQEEYRDGFLRVVEPGVTLQRASETSAEEAVVNLPFLPGDRVWTDGSGRVEFQFPEGTVVRLDTGSKLDYSDHDTSRDERVVLRLWSGSLILRPRAPGSAVFEIETPAGLVQTVGAGVVRVDVNGGEARVSVYEGEASLDTGRDSVQLVAGESTWARWGDAPAQPAPFDRYVQDDFAAWDGDLESRRAWAANSQRYLPEELEPYAPEFDSHGTWVYEQPVGYVWQPRVAVGWTPYTNGRWTWTLYGWTWVPYEPWGWAPHHYGRWGFSVSLGWYWAPGRVWGPGWVQWGYGGGYVGWCALGWRDRPVVPWPHHRGGAKPRYGPGHGGVRGYAVPRGSAAHDGAWTVVQRGDLRRGDYARRRVDPASVGGLRVADSIQERPDRGVQGLTRATARPRAVASRPRPGMASRASRGASPVPTGSLVLGRSSARSSSAAPRASRSRPRSTSGATASSPSARPGSGVVSSSPWSSRGASGGLSVRPPSASRGSGGVSRRPRSGQSTGGASSSPRSSGSSSRGLSVRPRSTSPRSSGVSSRPPSGRSTGGVSSSPRSSGSSSRGLSVRPRSTSPGGSGVSSRPPSGRSTGGVSSSPRSSGSSSRGLSVRPRSTSPRSSGTSSRPRSSPRSNGVSSRPRSSPRSSGASSRPRSSPRSSGASSRPRNSPRSSGASSRSRGSSGSSSPGGSSSRSRGSRRH
jgi:hypothetical protein